MELRNLPNTSGAQVVYEDKGNRFVVRDLLDQDNQILEKLSDLEKFDELGADPTQRVRERVGAFCRKWEEELNTFHPNINNFLTELEETNPSKVKGLVKCHKEPRPDGRHGIRLLLSSCGTPTQPASKFLHMSFSHLPHKLKDTTALLRKLSDINNEHPGGIPDTAINLGCDIVNMFGSINQEDGLTTLQDWLGKHPNPDGLPTQLLLELAKLCLEENACEFLRRFFCPNSGTVTGPPHACEFCDVAMAPMDERVEQELRQRGVQHTDWTIFRDDWWLVLLGGMADVGVVDEVLGQLHPNIKWEVNPRRPTAPPLMTAAGTAVDTSKLEHLDLSIYLMEGRLETDIYQKDIPIYISRRSCHPPATFNDVAKSVQPV